MTDAVPSWLACGPPVASADTLAVRFIEYEQVFGRQLHPDTVALLAVKILVRLDHDLVLAPIDRHQRMVANQLGGVDLAADGALRRVGDAAILRPDTGHGPGDLPLDPGLDLHAVGQEIRAVQRAVNDIHRR